MDVRYCLAHLLEDVPRLFLWKMSSRVEVIQKVPILSNFQCNEAVALCFHNLESADDVRMGDLLESGDFSRQKLLHISLVQFTFVDYFDGNLDNNNTKTV